MRLLIVVFIAGIVTFGSGLLSKTLTSRTLSDANSVYDDFVITESLWLYSDTIGSAAASDVERAKIALGGPLGLSSKEAVYFIATSDNKGDALVSSCDYRVSGTPIDTRWWSLTLYDTQTQHYVPNEINRSSWNSASIPRDEYGNWTIEVSQSEKSGAWLPTQSDDDKAFELNLRVYNPSDATRAILPDISVPVVEKTSC